MAAPSKSWTAITDGQVDGGSPVNETLTEAIRDNLVHLEEWLGDGYTAAKNHDHDGTNSKAVVLASGAITQAKLSTTTSEVSATSTSGESINPTNTAYAFFPQLRSTANGVSVIGSTSIWWTTASSSTLRIVLAVQTSGQTGYAKFTYIQSSPPYPLGDLPEWGPAWLFLRRRKSDGSIISACWTEDPPHEGHWTDLPKGHPARLVQFPHPFADFWAKPLPADEEIVLVDLRDLSGEVDLETPAQAQLRAMQAQRQAWQARGVAADVLERFERQSEAEVAKGGAPLRLPKHRALLRLTERAGSGPLSLVHGEAVDLRDPAAPALRQILTAAATADSDLIPSERKLIKGLPFRVVCAR
jgi:hypothetical protein